MPDNPQPWMQHQPSPIEALRPALLEPFGIRLLVKRDDLLHPHISGNKWRKLKYNLAEAQRLGCTKLVTFGGAYSNHLAATAAAGMEYGFSTMGVVRGERCEPLNPTLKYVEMCGMELFYASRANFRNKSNTDILRDLNFETKGCYILPEGGANGLALPGCREIVDETEAQLGELPDYLVVACGTGATLAGLASGLRGRSHALGVAVLKGEFHQVEVEKMLAEHHRGPLPSNWSVDTAHHWGGYAKHKPALVEFINEFKATQGLPLDPVYTGKAMFAIFDLAAQGFFPKNSTVLLVHTGGLQGIAGFNERNSPLLVL